MPDEEKHEPAALGDGVGGLRVMVQTDGVVPTKEDDDSAEGIPWKFNDDIGDHEGFPAICLTWTFADFVEGALGDEMRHYLLHELAEDGEEHEN